MSIFAQCKLQAGNKMRCNFSTKIIRCILRLYCQYITYMYVWLLYIGMAAWSIEPCCSQADAVADWVFLLKPSDSFDPQQAKTLTLSAFHDVIIEQVRW